MFPNFIKSLKKLFFGIKLICLLRIVLIVSEDLTLNEIDYKIININGQIIYVSENDNKIYKYNNLLLRTYSNINSGKKMIKINEEYFAIFGNSNNYFAYEIFKISDNNIGTYKNFRTNIAFNSKYNVTCSSEKNCILTFIDARKFKIYTINTDSSLTSQIETGTFLDAQGTANSCYDIICDSFDGENIFCIFSYKKSGNEDSWILYYAIANSGKIIDIDDEQIKNQQKLCEGKCFGNLAKEELNQKYLVCYKIFDTKLNVVCRYFMNHKNSILKEDDNSLIDIPVPILENPLILYIYDNTIFIEVDCNANFNSLLLISSIDFKISIPSVYTHSLNFINLFNDKKNYYLILEDRINKKTIIKKNNLVSCIDIKTIYFSDKDREIIDFSSEHIGHYISFSLDNSVKLEKNNNLISSHKNNFVQIESSSDIFEFNKIDNSNTLKNYYGYANSPEKIDLIENIFYSSFSLICPIDLKLCYEGCKECNLNKVSSHSNQFCYKCNNNYYPKNSEIGNADGYNCYLNSEIKEYYYFHNNKFYDCDETCRTCSDDNSCDTCKSGYYFKVDENLNKKKTEKCFNEIPNYHYFDAELAEPVYRPCYKTCKKCYKSGSEQSNGCINCIDEYSFYFDNNQCTTDKQICINNNEYWIFERNNIFCKNKDFCKDKSIIVDGGNKGQCVDDCQNYQTPIVNNIISDLYTFQCEDQKYCLSYDTCIKEGFNIENKNCISYKCEGEIDPYNSDPFDNINIIPPTTIIDTSTITPDDWRTDIYKRIKIIKMFTNENKDYETVLKNFDNTLIDEYNTILKNELINYDENTKLYLITNTKYKNFTITIYPLDVEDFSYEQIFITNNLGFANFTKLYKNFIEYEANNKNVLLVCIMEYYKSNSSINYLNYFLYSLDEDTYTGKMIYPHKTNLLEESSNKLEIYYPLYNYKNESSSINKRNTETLIDNIKTINSKYPEIDLSNIKDPFFNDICFLFTTDVGTDMSLNDRRKEYFISQSLCENNCSIITILRKELKNPRSLCSCDIKSEIFLDNIPGKADNIPSISSYNSKAISCIKKTFNKNSLSSNPIFWIFIILILFLIIMLVAFILYGKKELRKLINVYSSNFDEINSEAISSENNEIEKNLGKNLDKNNNYEKNHKKKEISKSMALNENKEKKSANNNIIESQQIEYLSAPINQSAPPKRKEMQRIPSVATKAENKTDELISNSEPSIFVASLLKPNEKENNTDISYDNLPNDDQIYVDNLLKEKNMLNNNYLRNPIEFEKCQRFQIMKNSLYPLDKLEKKKYCHSFEDIYFPKKNKNKENNKKKDNFGKNNNIKKLLFDGESDFENEDNSKNNNNHLSDNDFYEKKYKNDIKSGASDEEINDSLFNEEKGFEGDEIIPEEFFGKNKEVIFSDKGNKNNNLKKKEKNKKKGKINKNKNDEKDEKKEEEEEIGESENENKSQIGNDIIKTNKNKNSSGKSKARNRLLKSIAGKNNDKDMNEEEKQSEYIENKKNENLKTEYDIDAKNKIKSELKKIANGEDDSNSIGGIFKKNKKNNTQISNDSGSNNLINNKNPKVLKLKPKHLPKKDKNKHNKSDSSSNGMNSNRRMINFQEEEKEINGDMGIPITDENLKKKNSENNDNNISGMNENGKIQNSKKSESDIFRDKILASSVSAFLQTEGNKPILVEESFFLFYWRYFKIKELCLVSFHDKNKTIPYFVRWSGFVFCLIFIFLLNCLFFFEKNVHERYLNALKGNKNNIEYYFKNEFGISVCIALISNVFKIIFIKFVFYKLFKIKRKEKKMMKHSEDKRLNTEELEDLQSKRNKYLKIYKIKLIIYFILLLIFSILFAYMCICYAGIFRNSISAFLFGFLFSFIMSFIICALFCLIIVGIYWIGKKCKNRCILSTFIVLSTIY